MNRLLNLVLTLGLFVSVLPIDSASAQQCADSGRVTVERATEAFARNLIMGPIPVVRTDLLVGDNGIDFYEVHHGCDGDRCTGDDPVAHFEIEIVETHPVYLDACLIGSPLIGTHYPREPTCERPTGRGEVEVLPNIPIPASSVTWRFSGRVSGVPQAETDQIVIECANKWFRNEGAPTWLGEYDEHGITAAVNSPVIGIVPTGVHRQMWNFFYQSGSQAEVDYFPQVSACFERAVKERFETEANDADDDDVADACDLCPNDSNGSSDRDDRDSDGVGDNCDVCEYVANADQNPEACTASAVGVRMTNFIPCELVAAPGGRHSWHHGDNRGFGYEGSYRTRQDAVVIPGGSVQSGVNVLLQDFGRSEAYAPIHVAPTFNPNQWCDGTPIGPPEATGRLRPNGRNIWMSADRLRQGEYSHTLVRMGVDARNPLEYPWVPSINYELVLEFRHREGDRVEWRLRGRHDGFPAYELYLNRQRVYGFDPFEAGSNPLALFPLVPDVEVETTWQPVPEFEQP